MATKTWRRNRGEQISNEVTRRVKNPWMGQVVLWSTIPYHQAPRGHQDKPRIRQETKMRKRGDRRLREQIQDKKTWELPQDQNNGELRRTHFLHRSQT
ncbi:hypothetical protein Mapa_006359 [Marchantia paleacea]|nr:hypothetical protein Mapa_006359 [Marchantia paleacea]